MHSNNEMVNLRSVIETLCYMVDDDSDGVEEVMQLPTINLIRCKDCKHRALRATEIPDKGYCGQLMGWTDDDGYCYLAEMKGADNE